MYKRTYYIKFDSKELQEFDPNLDTALRDIFLRCSNRVSARPFDFETVLLRDGFISSDGFNLCLNAFLHDMLLGEKPYFSVGNEGAYDKYIGYVKDFIVHYNDVNRDRRLFNEANGRGWHIFDVFKRIEYEGKLQPFYVSVRMPEEEVMSDLSLLRYEPDFLINIITPEVMFKHVMAPLYYELYDLDLLENEEIKELRNVTTYRIGFH